MEQIYYQIQYCNVYHAILCVKVSEDNILKYFSYFSHKTDLTFHANCLLRFLGRQFVWNVKAYFLEKNKKNISKCRLLNLSVKRLKSCTVMN